MCFFRSVGVTNDLSHWLHAWFLTFSWTYIWWDCRVALWPKALPHLSQTWDFTPSCDIFTCFCKRHFIENSLSHWSHLWIFWAPWTSIEWVLSKLSLLKDSPQMLHLCSSNSSLWLLFTCSFNWLFWLNSSSQKSHLCNLVPPWRLLMCEFRLLELVKVRSQASHFKDFEPSCKLFISFGKAALFSWATFICEFKDTKHSNTLPQNSHEFFKFSWVFSIWLFNHWDDANFCPQNSHLKFLCPSWTVATCLRKFANLLKAFLHRWHWLVLGLDFLPSKSSSISSLWLLSSYSSSNTSP